MKMIDDEGNETTLEEVVSGLTQPGILATLDRNRSYDGQPHTDLGTRGKTEISGLTFRDVRDCFIRGCYDASGLLREDWPRDIYELPWNEIDPIAVFQNMSCWMERYIGIFPNVPELRANHEP